MGLLVVLGDPLRNVLVFVRENFLKSTVGEHYLSEALLGQRHDAYTETCIIGKHFHIVFIFLFFYLNWEEPSADCCGRHETSSALVSAADSLLDFLLNFRFFHEAVGVKKVLNVLNGVIEHNFQIGFHQCFHQRGVLLIVLVE